MYNRIIIDGTFYNPRPDVSTEMHHLLDLGAYSTRRFGQYDHTTSSIYDTGFMVSGLM